MIILVLFETLINNTSRKPKMETKAVKFDISISRTFKMKRVSNIFESNLN